MRQLGHEPRIIPAKYTRPFAKGQKNDYNDAEAIAEAAMLHYQVEVNKRGLSVTGLTKTLNARWDNGWRLAHMIEQRGNTVLVFERRV